MKPIYGKSFKWLIISLVFCGVLLLAVAGICYQLIFSQLMTTEKSENCAVFVTTNATFDEINNQIQECGEIKHPLLLKYYGDFYFKRNTIKPGYYSINPALSIYSLTKRIAHGNQTPVKLTFNHIRFKEQLAQRLSQQLMIDSAAVYGMLTNDSLIQSYGFSQETFMAMFIPNTYEVYWTITPQELALRMSKEYKRFWNEKRLAQAQAIGLTPIEVATLASIVEEESNKGAEKPIIAGLYMNRLKMGMPLQSDPTVRYAVGDFGLHRILYKHLTMDSPYNTYIYAGLPPGPIAMPSIQGLEAVLNYKHHNYIYMCAKESLNGEHNFAVSLEEHNRNAARYHKALKEWEKKAKK